MAVAGALAAMGCAADYVTGNEASVNMYITSINEGSPLDSDVRNGDPAVATFVCENEVAVSFAIRAKNPNAPTPSVPNAVIVDSYQVQYFRTDGRGAEGIDVPFRITGNLTIAADVSDSDNTVVNIEVVRRQAKLEPPLTNIQQTALLTAMAEITLYGHTIAGDRVSAAGRMQITFADYADDETSCPTN